jgi:succinate dehydrogenase / fumarate reductase cytochrome b subunit
MARDHHRGRSGSISAGPTAQRLKGAIDSGRTGDKAVFRDSAASPLGADDEAAGNPDTSSRVATTIRDELQSEHRSPASPGRPRPISPNIQIYRPQLTSVLSIANRITGVVLSAGAVGLVVWLVAAASGPQAYAGVQTALVSWIGQVALIGFTFAFFLHLCGGIRHLVWDTVRGFELRSIYLGGWIVVVASVALTVATWVASAFIRT